MKHKKLIALLASALIICSVHAGREESGWIRKTARVVFYGAETAVGCHFFNVFHGRAPQSLWPWDVASKMWNNKRGAGSEAFASAVLLWHGLRGLDKELRITEQLKKK